MGRQKGPAVLDEAWAAFIQGGVSIVASSRDREHVPRTARANGCRLSRDRRTVTALFPVSRSRSLIEAADSSGAFAIVFTQPSTHVSLQLKGADARIVETAAADARLVERYARAFAADLEPLGFSREFVRALVGCGTTDLAAIAFTPDAVFIQTPGPRAGEPIEKAAAAC